MANWTLLAFGVASELANVFISAVFGITDSIGALLLAVSDGFSKTILVITGGFELTEPEVLEGCEPRVRLPPLTSEYAVVRGYARAGIAFGLILDDHAA